MAQTAQRQNADSAGAPVRHDGARSKSVPFRDRKLTFTVSLPKILFSVLFLLFLLIWVFIFGIMLGRGHNPEQVVPELAKVMPAPSVTAENPADEGINDVIPPQDLKYHDQLKKNDVPEKPAPEAQPKSSQPTPVKPQAAPVNQTPPASKPASNAITGSQPDPDQSVYNYVYQVAAFNNVTAAQAMQKKLQDGGFSARIAQSETRGATWYRILVSFRGKPEDTRVLRTKLAPYGISAVILRGKTPVK